MLLSSVVLLLRETLEVVLLVSVLMAIGHLLDYRKLWLPLGLLAGVLLAFAYAVNMTEISSWFDYVGQEVANALMQVGIAIILIVLGWVITRGEGVRWRNVFQVCAAVGLGLAVTREGSEIFIYLSGFFSQQDKLQSVLIGGGIGFCIGVSVGALLFYGLLGLPRKWGVIASFVLMALIAGNMLSQATLQLTQADWISSAGAMWDSSAWIPENSLAGQLLYALVGYEATPSAAQVAAYFGGVLTLLGVIFTARKRHWRAE